MLWLPLKIEKKILSILLLCVTFAEKTHFLIGFIFVIGKNNIYLQINYIHKNLIHSLSVFVLFIYVWLWRKEFRIPFAYLLHTFRIFICMKLYCITKVKEGFCFDLKSVKRIRKWICISHMAFLSLFSKFIESLG